MIVPERIGHVVIKVRDIARTRQFYTDVMGLTLMMEIPKIKMAFFASNGRDHHERNRMHRGRRRGAGSAEGRNRPSAYCVSPARRSASALAPYLELKEKHVPIVSTVDHGITKSVYFRDPDGHQIEIYCDNPPEYIASLPDSIARDGQARLLRRQTAIKRCAFGKMTQ